MTPEQTSYLRRAAALSGHSLHPGDVVTLVRQYLAVPSLGDDTCTTRAMLARDAEQRVDEASALWHNRTGVEVA